MNTEFKEISLADLAAYFETFLESQYFHWKLLSISDIVFVDGFTIATITYQIGDPEVKTFTKTSRWSYRREDWDDRIIAHFYDWATVGK